MKWIKLDKIIYKTTSKVWSHNLLPVLSKNRKHLRKGMKIIDTLHWLIIEKYETS
jgi:hypothetical protein